MDSTRSIKLDGDELRRVRTAKGWNQQTLADRAGLAKRTIENAEKGLPVLVSNALWLAKALDARVEELQLSVADRHAQAPGRGIATSYFDTTDLAALQSPSLEEVWVYAPYPLETLQSEPHRSLRKQVLNNLMSGVRYVYFVESEHGLSRIQEFLRCLSREGSAPIEKLEKQTSVVVLPSGDFLTYYTVHRHVGGQVEVFQSLITRDRHDVLMKLCEERSTYVFTKISDQMRAMQALLVGNLRVLRSHPRSRSERHRKMS